MLCLASRSTSTVGIDASFASTMSSEYIGSIIDRSEWQPDTILCSICDAKFWKLALRFRHHCRRCGLCICGSCSEKVAVDTDGRRVWQHFCRDCLGSSEDFVEIDQGSEHKVGVSGDTCQPSTAQQDISTWSISSLLSENSLSEELLLKRLTKELKRDKHLATAYHEYCSYNNATYRDNLSGFLGTFSKSSLAKLANKAARKIKEENDDTGALKRKDSGRKGSKESSRKGSKESSSRKGSKDVMLESLAIPWVDSYMNGAGSELAGHLKLRRESIECAEEAPSAYFAGA